VYNKCIIDVSISHCLVSKIYAMALLGPQLAAFRVSLERLAALQADEPPSVDMDAAIAQLRTTLEALERQNALLSNALGAHRVGQQQDPEETSDISPWRHYAS